MAVRPDRKDPISTRPIYLPVVPSKELNELAPRLPKSDADLAVYTDLLAQRQLDASEIAAAATVVLGRRAEAGGDFFARILVAMSGTRRREAVAAAANAMAWARVRNLLKETYRAVPLRGEVDYERARLHARLHPEFGEGGLSAGGYVVDLLYDAAAVQGIYADLLQKPRAIAASIVVTDRRLVSWDAGAGRWQPVSSVVGNPFVLALPSEDLPPRVLVEAIRLRFNAS